MATVFLFVALGLPFRCVVSAWHAPTQRGNLEFFKLDRFDPKLAVRLGSIDFGAEYGDTHLRHQPVQGGDIGDQITILKQHGARELAAKYVLYAI